MQDPVFLDPALDQEFREKGFVTIPLLSPEEVEEIKGILMTLNPNDGFEPTEEKQFFNDYHCTFLDKNEEYKRLANKLIQDSFSDRFKAIVNGFYIINGNFYYKPPNKGRFQMHQNWIHVPEWHITSLTAWVPFQDITPQNGGLRLVPGSHKITPDVGTFGLPYYFANIEDYLIEDHLLPVYPKAGECVLFDDSVIHWSERNESAEARIAVQIEMIPEGVPSVIYIPKEAEGEKWFDLHEINHEFFFKESLESQPSWHERLPYFGRQPNTNKLVTKEEFLELLKAGPETRKKLYNTPIVKQK